MPSLRPPPRLGLSFELAPPPPVDPLRTDVALVVGLVARRRVEPTPGRLVPLPPLLARWLAGQGIASTMPARAAALQARLTGAAVRLDGGLEFASSVVAAAAPDDAGAVRAWFQRLAADLPRRSALVRLLHALRTTSTLPEALIEDLRLRGHTPQSVGDAAELERWVQVQGLFNMPVPLDSFDTVGALFDWRARPLDVNAAAPVPPLATPVGATLRAFFAEGGQRAWLVRTGNPAPILASAGWRREALLPATLSRDRCRVLPGAEATPDPAAPPTADAAAVALSAADWQGLEHAYGLPDVSFALLPDLADSAASTPPSLQPPEGLAIPEAFADCAEAATATPGLAGRRLSPPRHDGAALARWRDWVLHALALLDNNGRAFHRRDVQLLASLPLTVAGQDAPVADDWLDWMAAPGGWMDDAAPGPSRALLSERLQLAWPWLITRDSDDCPGRVEAPEGTLAGVLARSALQRGGFRSAARQPVGRLIDTEPRPAWRRAIERTLLTPVGTLALAERLCLIGPGPDGPRLLSDVSASALALYRQASVRRLVNLVIQAARRLGEQHVFEPNGDRLWARLRSQLGDLLRRLETAGALSRDGGESTVRCGRETMSQADLDAGRLIVEIALRPAQPVQRIVVVLNLRDASSAALRAAA